LHFRSSLVGCHIDGVMKEYVPTKVLLFCEHDEPVLFFDSTVVVAAAAMSSSSSGSGSGSGSDSSLSVDCVHFY